MEIWTFDPETREGGKVPYKSFDEMCSGKPFAEQIMQLGAAFYAESRTKVRWLVFEPEEELYVRKIGRDLFGGSDGTIMLAALLESGAQRILFEHVYKCVPYPLYTTEEGLQPEMQDKTERLAIRYDALPPL